MALPIYFSLNLPAPPPVKPVKESAAVAPSPPSQSALFVELGRHLQCPMSPLLGESCLCPGFQSGQSGSGAGYWQIELARYLVELAVSMATLKITNSIMTHPIRTQSERMKSSAQLCFIFWMPIQRSEFLQAMCKLTLVAVFTRREFFKGSALLICIVI